MTLWLALFPLLPLVAAMGLLTLPTRRSVEVAAALMTAGVLVAALRIGASLASGGESISGPLVGIDPLGVLELAGMSFLILLIQLHGWGQGEDDDLRRIKWQNVWSLGLVATTALTLVTRDVAILGLGVGSSAVCLALLIGASPRPRGAGAAWRLFMFAATGTIITLFAASLIAVPGTAVEANASGWTSFGLAISAAPTGPASMTHLALALALLGFGITAGLVPLNGWLGAAHTYSPGTAAALVSAVLLNLSVYAIVRYRAVLPATESALTVLVVAGLATGVAGVLLMLRSRGLGELLAGSSSQQIGLALFAAGIGGAGLIAAILHSLTHAFAKTLLLLSSGRIVEGLESDDLDLVAERAPHHPIASSGLAVGALATACVPPAAGFVSLAAIFRVVFSGAGDGAGAVTAMIAAITVIAGFAALFRGIHFAFFTPSPEGKTAGPALTDLVLVLLVVVIVGFGVSAPTSVRNLVGRAGSDLAGETFETMDLATSQVEQR